MKFAEGKEALELEADAFDNQIDERLAAGFIPDLQNAKECTYFYNNSWRHPDYVQLDFGEQFDLIREAIEKYKPSSSLAARVLEVGCGPGHMTLELARNQYNATGLDLSAQCVAAAKKTAAADPLRAGRGPLIYVQGDFLEEKMFAANSFDAIVFIGALHHFPDQTAVAKQVGRILVHDGIVVVHEPTRDRMTKGNAAFIHLVRLLLSQGNGFFKDIQVPASKDEYLSQVDTIFAEMRYEEESGEKKQSVNDNEAGFVEIKAALQQHFTEVHFQERYAFFHELIGGLRYDQEKNKQLAWYFRSADEELCRLGVLQSTEFFYVGRKVGKK